MDRLTEYVCGAAHGKRGRTVEEASKSKDFCRGEFEATGCIERLAAYEDTGLMPDEIKNMQFCYSKALQKIREQEAEKDGGVTASAWMTSQPPKGEKS